MSVVSVGSPSAKALASFNTREVTLVKGLMNAMNVGNPLPTNLISFNTREFTLEKDLMSVVSVGNLLVANLTSLDTGEFTLEESLKCAGNVVLPQYNNTGGDSVRAIYLNLNLLSEHTLC